MHIQTVVERFCSQQDIENNWSSTSFIMFMEYNHRVRVAEDSSLHKSAVTVLHLDKYYTRRAALTLSQKIFEKCFSKWFHVWNANTVQVRHKFCSMNCKFLSNIGFYLFFIFTRVCLFHTVTVDADLTGVHTTV